VCKQVLLAQGWDAKDCYISRRNFSNEVRYQFSKLTGLTHYSILPVVMKAPVK
jgi:hypothetical protein